MDKGHFEPYYLGPNGITHAAGSGGATAVMGVAANSWPPSIEVESGYHEHHSDTLRLPAFGHAKPSTFIGGGWQAIHPAKDHVLSVKSPASVQQATPPVPDVVASLPILVLACVASGVWIARYLVRAMAGLGFAA